MKPDLMKHYQKPVAVRVPRHLAWLKTRCLILAGSLTLFVNVMGRPGVPLTSVKLIAAPAQSPALTLRRKDVIVDKNAKGQEAIFALSRDGRTLATKVDQVHKITLWEMATRKAKAELQTGSSYIAKLSFSSDGQWLMASTIKGEVSVWDTQTGELKARLNPDYKSWLALPRTALDWKNWLVATSLPEKPLIKLWDLRTGQLLRTLEHPPRQNPFNPLNPTRLPETPDGAAELAFTYDGHALLSVSQLFDRIYLWNLKTGQLEKTLIGGRPLLLRERRSHGSSIYELVLDPAGRYLATPSRDGTAGLWDLRTMEWVTSIGDFGGRVVSAAFSADGQTLAAASADQDRKVKLWDVEGNRLLATLTGFKKDVYLYPENFSPDGKLIAVPSVGSRNPGLKLWDARTGQLLATLDEARQPVAFTPDGKTLLTGGLKGEVVLWEVRRD